MATEVIAGGLGELRAASTAAGGTALSTTIAYIQLPLGTEQVLITARNFATAVVAQVLLNPWLTILKTGDNLASQPVDYSNAAQDASTGTSVVLSSLDTLANGDYVLVGSHLPFAGVNIDVDGDNDTVSTLTVSYWNGNAWVTTGATDGTASASKTLKVDGSVTWTVPTAWQTASLEDIFKVSGSITNLAFAGKTEKLYWTRWSVSVALDSEVTLDSMLAINRSTLYGELLSGQVFEETVKVGPGDGGIGCIQAKTNAGTANLIVNVATKRGSRFQ